MIAVGNRLESIQNGLRALEGVGANEDHSPAERCCMGKSIHTWRMSGLESPVTIFCISDGSLGTIGIPFDNEMARHFFQQRRSGKIVDVQLRLRSHYVLVIAWLICCNSYNKHIANRNGEEHYFEVVTYRV